MVTEKSNGVAMALLVRVTVCLPHGSDKGESSEYVSLPWESTAVDPATEGESNLTNAYISDMARLNMYTYVRPKWGQQVH